MTENIEKKEIEEMFNTTFLPKVLEFVKRSHENYEGEEILYYATVLNFSFLPGKESLTYEDIEHNVRMQIQPVTQSDVDRWKKEQENAENTFEKV